MYYTARALRIVLATACCASLSGLLGCGDDDAGSNPDLGSGDGGGSRDAAPMDAAPDAEPADLGVDMPPDPVPPFRNPVALADDELARQALRILGAPEAGATTRVCNECHSVTRARINQWRVLSDASMMNCLTDLDVPTDASAAAMLACLRGTRTSYGASSLGIWATAAHLPWFDYVFRHSTSGEWMLQHSAFVMSAGMPRNPDTRFTQEQFDIVAEWFIRGTPNVDDVLPAGGAPTECIPYVGADVGTHVAAMATDGWAARNAAAGMLMHGCAGAASAADCLATVPLASTTAFGADWDVTGGGGVAGAHLRVLHTTDYETSYWTRSSADGRFVSHGADTAPNLRFIDLQEDRVFGGSGLYDTSFFPDGSGFAIQGGRSGAHVCENRVLTTGMPTMLAFDEPGCTGSISIGLYEHLGTSLDGADFWAISGTATYDNGGHSPTLRDPLADFPASASDTITRMLNTGTGFTLGGEFELDHPYEGDGVISPSFTTLLTRQAGRSGQLGYVLRRLEVTGSPASFSVEAPEIAHYCINGGKPAFSYDERWLVTHHYVTNADAVKLGFTGSSDPAFAAYRTRGAANVYLVDLTTGVEYRLTNMAAGQYALFPHFRSDGWIYFIVRDESSMPEHIVASDAALLAAAL
jgi:opacity protein-like surface antigen